jgi:hypothetical protein
MIISCNYDSTISAVPGKQVDDIEKKMTDNDEYKEIKAIPLPAGYSRVNNDADLFADYLRKIKLKESRIVYL